MTSPALLQTETRHTVTETQQARRNKAQENFKIALGGLAALITGIVLLAVFSNPFLITLGVVLLIVGCVACDHLFWERVDSKLNGMRRCDCTSTNQIGLELGSI
jgi:uncharacterized membrane protein HdeD (DUF308 family)